MTSDRPRRSTRGEARNHSVDCRGTLVATGWSVREPLDEDEQRQLTSPNPSFQSIAQRLILDASKGHEDAAAMADAAEHVFQALHVHLARLIGAIGFRALLARALTLASPGSPALARIKVTPEGTLAGLAEAITSTSTSPAEALAASARLLAAFLDLLAAFVGDDLALHLVDETTRSGPSPDDPRVERASD